MVIWKPWDVATEALGFLGSLVMAVPWFRDFAERFSLHRVRKIVITGPLTRLHTRLVEHLKISIERPRSTDFIYMLVGLLLLALSFGINLWKLLFSAS